MFLKERAVKHWNSTTMISGDAKCKVSVREPNFLKVAMSRRKVVIFGKKDKFKAGDQNLSKVPVILDANLVHLKPEEDHKEDGEDTKWNKDSGGKWYSGKVFYRLKEMTIRSSSTMQWKTELRTMMEVFYGPENVPLVYVGIRIMVKIKKHKLQKSPKKFRKI